MNYYNEIKEKLLKSEIYDSSKDCSKDKWATSWTKLCWSHYREVLSFKDINEIRII